MVFERRLLLLLPLFVIFSSAGTLFAAQAASDTKYEIAPSRVVPGGAYTFAVTASPCDKTGTSNPFEDLTPLSSSSGELKLSGGLVSHNENKCIASVSGTVAADATGDDLNIFLNKTVKASTDKPTIMGTLPLKVQIAKPPSPIPPGLNPEVDLMWKVLPRRVVADSYGNRVSDKYFAIEAVVGNNSGFDLQIAAIGFETPYYDCIRPGLFGSHKKQAMDSYDKDKRKDSPDPYFVNPHFDPCGDGKAVVPRRPVSIDMPTPTDAYPVVRSTIEREQFVGRRAIIVNLVKATGSTLVGVGALLPDAGTFVKTTSLINGPFEKGIELVYPDLTTAHLIGLDNRTLRDGTVISNNTSVRVNVFISREIVMCTAPPHWYNFDFSARRTYTCITGDARVPYQYDFNPEDIRERLGELTVIGRKIQYLERVRVLSNTSDLPESKPGPRFAQQTIYLARGEDRILSLPGTNLRGVVVVSNQPDDLKITDQSVAADGSSITVHVSVSKEVKPYTRIPLTASSSLGFASLQADIEPPAPTISDSGITVSDDRKTVTVSGTNLDYTSAVVSSGDKVLPHTLKHDSDTKLILTFPEALAPANNYDLIVAAGDRIAKATIKTP